MRIYTIGHSTRSIDDFLKILQKYKITLLVDLRSLPGSTFNPQFNDKELAFSLSSIGVKYLRLAGLTGFRKPKENSINKGLKQKSFRAFADHMQTQEFKKALQKLIKLGKEYTVMIMCAEAVVWKCHRSLVGDALVAHKVKVYDVYDQENVKLHKLPSYAKVIDHSVVYPEI